MAVGDPFTLRIFVPDGDPEGVRIIDRMNWTGLGIVFPREKWPATKQRPEFSRPGVYILTGYRSAEDELPTVYIGESDVLRSRIDTLNSSRHPEISPSGNMPQSHSKPPLDVTCACRATEPPRRHDHGGQSTGSWPPSWGCHNDIVADGFEPTWRTTRTASLAGPRPSGSYLPGT